MEKFNKSIFCIFLFVISFNALYSQDRGNLLIGDEELENILRTYLIEHIDYYTVDSLGNKIPFNPEYIQEEYGDVYVVLEGLKTDSNLLNKRTIGIYAFRFADDSSSPHLYIQHSKKIEFLDLYNGLNINKLLKKLKKFFNKNSNEFSQKEIVKSLEGVMGTILNMFEVNAIPPHLAK